MEANSSCVLKVNINKPDRSKIALNNPYEEELSYSMMDVKKNSLTKKCEDSAKKKKKVNFMY